MSLILHAMRPDVPVDHCRAELDRRKDTFRWTTKPRREGDQVRVETIRSATTRHLFYLFRSLVRASQSKRVRDFIRHQGRLSPVTTNGWTLVLVLDEIQIRGDLERSLVSELNQLIALIFDNEMLFNLRRVIREAPTPRQGSAPFLNLDLSRPSRDPQFPPLTGSLANDIEARRSDDLFVITDGIRTPYQPKQQKPEPKEVTELTSIGRRKIQTD